ncbi:hypothetical protein CEXT_56571 [Caerostris extrusa]|uniref:Uncharacterized protein n=1 Tax=Caerostris extrusa TaxID=172846 RepID=A0AAV4T0V6_CAEEX|nr:hypothetical protein CEXT_56571 [Caerostris extrusa]
MSITTQCFLLTRHCYSNDTILWDTVTSDRKKCGPNVVKMRRCPAMTEKGAGPLEGHRYSNDTTLWDTVTPDRKKCGPNGVKIRRCPVKIGKGLSPGREGESTDGR